MLASLSSFNAVAREIGGRRETRLEHLHHQWTLPDCATNMTAIMHETAAQTLDILEERLGRVSYVLNGHTDGPEQPRASEQTDGTAMARLRTLERTLQSLQSKSPPVAEILHFHKAHPAVFDSAASPTAASSILPSELAEIVLAHAPAFHATSTRLQELQDLSVPESAAYAKLVELQPRLQKAAARQDQQAAEVAELRARSARAVEQWYQMGVLDMSERWAEWEGRVRDVEILVRRNEAVKRREEGIV